jgi:hypothetical protein
MAQYGFRQRLVSFLQTLRREEEMVLHMREPWVGGWLLEEVIATGSTPTMESTMLDRVLLHHVVRALGIAIRFSQQFME